MLLEYLRLQNLTRLFYSTVRLLGFIFICSRKSLWSVCASRRASVSARYGGAVYYRYISRSQKKTMMLRCFATQGLYPHSFPCKLCLPTDRKVTRNQFSKKFRTTVVCQSAAERNKFSVPNRSTSVPLLSFASRSATHRDLLQVLRNVNSIEAAADPRRAR